tara:strand:- start:5352 stop:6224 length:873 start_codon:yes stop_codon:yes gene_type:complete
MYSGEDMLLNLRINELNRFVDKFVISEAAYHHDGSKKKLTFKIKDYEKFKNKINYIVVDEEPSNIQKLLSSDNQIVADKKKILNSLKRENHQRNQLERGIEESEDEDLIIVSDLDEIPNLKKITENQVENKILIFKQKIFYYKLNLVYKDFVWFGSKATKKKNLKSPQSLRNVKNKKYQFWRIDTIFSDTKFRNIEFIDEGGWHFTCIMNPKDLQKKLKTFLHHQDFENSGIKLKDLENKIKNKIVLYNHTLDKKDSNKWDTKKTLEKVSISTLPDYVSENESKLNDWLD